MLKVKWERRTATYSNGWTGAVGKWKVVFIDFDGCKPPEGKSNKVTTVLPGVKILLGHYETHEEAVKRAEKVVAWWYDNLINYKDE